MNTPVRGQHALATTTMWSALRISRPAIRLADPKLIPPNARSLHQQHPAVYRFTTSRNPISAAPVSASASRFLIRAAVEEFQTRSFTSTGSIGNHARHSRSAADRRHRRVVPNRPLVGITRDGLPRTDKKPIPFSPFRASSFADALVRAVVGVGISGFCKYEHVGSNEAEWALVQFSWQEPRTWGGTN